MEAKFALFAWETYEAQGGMNDMRCGPFAGMESCKAEFERLVMTGMHSLDVGLIYDMTTCRPVLEASVQWPKAAIVNDQNPPPIVEWIARS